MIFQAGFGSTARLFFLGILGQETPTVTPPAVTPPATPPAVVVVTPTVTPPITPVEKPGFYPFLETVIDRWLQAAGLPTKPAEPIYVPKMEYDRRNKQIAQLATASGSKYGYNYSAGNVGSRMYRRGYRIATEAVTPATLVVTPPAPDRATILKQVTDQILQSYRYPVTITAGRTPPVMTTYRYAALVAKIQAQAKLITRRWGEYMFYSPEIEVELKSRGFFPPVDSGILADTYRTAYRAAVDEIVRGPQWTPRGVRLIPAGTRIPAAEYDAMIERMADRAIAIFIEILNRDYGAGQGEHYASVGSYSKRTTWIRGVRDWLNFRRIYRGRAVAVTPVVTPVEITPVVTPADVTPALRQLTAEVISRIVLKHVAEIKRVRVGTRLVRQVTASAYRQLVAAIVSDIVSWLQGLSGLSGFGQVTPTVDPELMRQIAEGVQRALKQAGVEVAEPVPTPPLPVPTPPVPVPTPPLPVPTPPLPVPTPPVPVLPTLDEWARLAPVFPDYAACVAAARAATGRVPDRYFHCTCIQDAVTAAVDNALEEAEVTTKAITPDKYAAVVADAINVGNQMVAQRTYTPTITGRMVAFPRRR